MTLQYHMATTAAACRVLVRVGRRCRTPTSVARPLAQHVLGSRQAVAAVSGGDVGPVRDYSARPSPFPSSPPASRGWAPRGPAAAAAPALSLGLGLMLPSAARREISSSTGRRGWPAAAFSTNASGGEEGKGNDHANADANAHSSADAAAGVDAAGKEGGKGDAEKAGGGSGSGGGGDGGGGVKAAEVDPLGGLVPDDGDPGPPPPLDPSIVTEPSPKVLEVMEAIDSLNFMELAMLIDVFKNKLGLDEIPTLNYGGAEGDDADGGGGGGGAEAAVEKTIFNVKVTEFGKSKVKVIKEVRTITGLGLREAKEVVESLPQVIKEDLKLEEAEAMKAKLEAVGATVELE